MRIFNSPLSFYIQGKITPSSTSYYTVGDFFSKYFEFKHQVDADITTIIIIQKKDSINFIKDCKDKISKQWNEILAYQIPLTLKLLKEAQLNLSFITLPHSISWKTNFNMSSKTLYIRIHNLTKNLLFLKKTNKSMVISQDFLIIKEADQNLYPGNLTEIALQTDHFCSGFSGSIQYCVQNSDQTSLTLNINHKLTSHDIKVEFEGLRYYTIKVKQQKGLKSQFLVTIRNVLNVPKIQLLSVSVMSIHKMPLNLTNLFIEYLKLKNDSTVL